VQLQCLQRAPGRRVTELSHLFHTNRRLPGTGDQNQATCVASSENNSSDIHYNPAHLLKEVRLPNDCLFCALLLPVVTRLQPLSLSLSNLSSSEPPSNREESLFVKTKRVSKIGSGLAQGTARTITAHTKPLHSQSLSFPRPDTESGGKKPKQKKSKIRASI
jgi:hypothetical protein